MITTTIHAEARMQQRRIPVSVLEWLDEFGAREKSRGQEIVYFDKKSKKLLARELGPQVVKCISKFLSVYAVMSADGDVITTGYRFKRLRRH